MPSTDLPLLRRLQDAAGDFSRSQRELARYISTNYQSAAFATVSQFAAQTGVSEATIVRFARALGFTGYPALQQEIRRLVRADLRGDERFRLGRATGAAKQTPVDVIADKERENIATLCQSHDQQTFGRALQMLRTASEVVVAGTRATAPLASHFWFALGKLGIPAARATTISSETYDRISRLDRRACVMVIGFPRYLREQVNLLEYAKHRRLATLTVTDSAFSPLQGRVSLYAPAESASFVAFHGAPLVLLNALIHALGVADEKNTLAALTRFEAVAESQGYFFNH
jgi:DNA-binding MurR/RpiR family transcriptional regulator